jgi:hypothetical protein
MTSTDLINQCLYQVNEALKLAIQLIPSVARDVEDTHMVLAKEKIIVDDTELLCRFSRDILPVLIKVLLITTNELFMSMLALKYELSMLLSAGSQLWCKLVHLLWLFVNCK